jgi:hypothetical protein
VIFLNFYNHFSIEKGDMTEVFFLKYFSMEKDGVS